MSSPQRPEKPPALAMGSVTKLIVLCLLLVACRAGGVGIVMTTTPPPTPDPKPVKATNVIVAAYSCHIYDDHHAWTHVLIVNKENKPVTNIKGTVTFVAKSGNQTTLFVADIVVKPNQYNTAGPYLVVVDSPKVVSGLKACKAEFTYAEFAK